jgi:hypothetical protein
MPVNISASDRRLLLWAAVIVTVLVIALAVFSSNQQESEIPSTYSADSAGAKAAFMLLQQQGYNVERWEQSPNELPADVTDTTLVLASPFNPPSKQEKASLQLYLSRGGRILATGYTASLFLPQAETVPEVFAGPDWKAFEPQLLSPLTRAGTIRMSPGAYWKNSHTCCLVHYADGDRPVVVSYKVGKGEVVWWASATPLSNAGITVAGNLALLLNSLGSRDVHILWDEYFHGYRQTLGAYLSEPPLLFALLQCFFLLGVVLLTFSRRSLPIHPQQEKSRLSPLEFVETLGGLYRRARTNRAALEVPYTRFRTIVTRRLGLRTDISADDLARSLRKRLAYKDGALPELLRRIEATLAQDEPGEEIVLGLAQELNRHMQNLKLLQESFPHGERVPGVETRAK